MLVLFSLKEKKLFRFNPILSAPITFFGGFNPSCTKWSCKTLFEMEDTDILYTNNHVVTYVPDPNQTFRL